MNKYEVHLNTPFYYTIKAKNEHEAVREAKDRTESVLYSGLDNPAVTVTNRHLKSKPNQTQIMEHRTSDIMQELENMGYELPDDHQKKQELASEFADVFMQKFRTTLKDVAKHYGLNGE